MGRLDDLNIDGMDLIRDIRKIYDNYGFKTNVLAASIRTANYVKVAALAGAVGATIPPAVNKSLVNHVLTDKGIEQFTKDWTATDQGILQLSEPSIRVSRDKEFPQQRRSGLPLNFYRFATSALAVGSSVIRPLMRALCNTARMASIISSPPAIATI